MSYDNHEANVLARHGTGSVGFGNFNFGNLGISFGPKNLCTVV